MPWSSLGGGGVCLICVIPPPCKQLFENQSVVEYWENFANHAFENTTQSVYSHCVLLKPSGAPVPCTFCFSIRRDIMDLPSLVIGTSPLTSSLSHVGHSGIVQGNGYPFCDQSFFAPLGSPLSLARSLALRDSLSSYSYV